MHARVVLGAGKGVLFGDVSLVQVCPYRGVPLYSQAIQNCVLVLMN